MLQTARLLALAVLCGALAPPSSAQPAAPNDESPMDRSFDSSTLVTVEGTIVAVHRRVKGPRDECLVLLTPAGTLDVHLGPVAFVDAEPVQLHAGDRVTVRGSRVSMEGVVQVIAVEVRRGGQVLALRRDDGSPRWKAPAGEVLPSR